jgi:hypothetical protein
MRARCRRQCGSERFSEARWLQVRSPPWSSLTVVGWAKRSVPTVEDGVSGEWWARRECAFAHPRNFFPSCSVVKWIPGSTLARRPGMTGGGVMQRCMPPPRNLPVVPLCRGLLQLISPPNQWLPFARLVPHRGAARDRHGRWEWDAMDAAASGARIARGRVTLQRTAKSCGPGAPTQALRSRNPPRMTVATKHGHRGEHEGNR